MGCRCSLVHNGVTEMFSENYSRQTAIASVNSVVAANLSDHELASLARSEEAKVRAAVAEREGTPLTSLILLAQDVAPAVRAGVARNPRVDLPVEIREDLSKDKSPEVVYALIDNPAVPDAIIQKLARQRHKEYSSAARDRLAGKKSEAKQGVKIFGISVS